MYKKVKKLSRLCILSLISITALTSCSGSNIGRTVVSNTVEKINTDNDKLAKIHVSCNYDLCDATISADGKLIISDKEHLKIYNSDLTEEKTYKNIFSYCSSLCTRKDKIYAFESKGSLIKELNFEGQVLSEYKPDNIQAVKKMQLVGDNVVMSIYYNDQHNMAVYNLNENKTDFFNIDGIRDFAAFDETSIIVVAEDKETPRNTKIFVYDINKKEILKQYSIERIATDIAYSKEENCIYYISGENVYCSDLDTNEYRPVYMSDNTSLSPIIISNDNCIIIYKKNMVACKVNKNDICYDFNYSEKIDNVSNISAKIKILANAPITFMDNLFKASIRNFSQKYPNCYIYYECIPDMTEYRKEIKTRIAAGNTDFDIFINDFDMKDGNFLKDNICLDLNSYQGITDLTQKMFPGFVKCSTYNNQLLGIPFYYYAQAWKVNDELLGKLGINLPEGKWTWSDFYEFSKNINIDIDGDGIKDVYALASRRDSPLLSAYQYEALYFNNLNNVTTLNSREYINILELSKKMYDEGLIYIYDSSEKIPVDKVLFTPIQFSLWLGNEHCILPPTLDDFEVYNLNILSLISINRNSSNKDIAADFIATYISEPSIYNKTAVTLFKSRDEYSDVSAMLHGHEGEIKFSNADNYKIFERILNNSAIYNGNTDYINSRSLILSKFYNNEIAANEAARQIDEVTAKIKSN